MNFGTSSSGFTVWLTGMSGAGKSTLAQGLANRLRRLGKIVEVLDGDEVDKMLGIGNAQTKDERNAEARKLAWACKLVTRGGGIIFQSAIESPYRETRDEARRQIGRFAEVFVECPTETLIHRDRSGKYKKALAGELKTLVGITEPYEPPLHAEVVIDTSKHSIDESVEHILGQLVAQRLLDPSVAAMKGRPKVQARAAPSKVVPVPKAVAAPRPVAGPRPVAATKPEMKPAKAEMKPKAKVVKLSSRKPVKAARTVPARKTAAARTARADRPRKAAGGRKR
jgi:adenylylsulfate kinase